MFQLPLRKIDSQKIAKLNCIFQVQRYCYTIQLRIFFIEIMVFLGNSCDCEMLNYPLIRAIRESESFGNDRGKTIKISCENHSAQ